MDPSSNVIYHEGQVLGDELGQRVRNVSMSASVIILKSLQVGDTYLFNANTSKVLDNINKRLSEEDRSNRSYRRFLSFSQVKTFSHRGSHYFSLTNRWILPVVSGCTMARLGCQVINTNIFRTIRPTYLILLNMNLNMNLSFGRLGIC